MDNNLSQRGPLRVLAASLALTVVAYVNAFSNPFLYDDEPLITVNALLRNWRGLETFFAHATMTSSPVWTQHYRPFLMLTFWINYQLSGVAPAAYRLTNLGIHLVNGWLAFCVLRRVLGRRLDATTRDWASAFGASIFLLHPVQTITMDMVLKRNSSLCTLLTFAALLLWARAHEAMTKPRQRALWAAALIAGALAMLTKEDGIAVPALVALFALATGVGRAREALPFFIAPLIFVLRIAPLETIAREESTALGHLLAQPTAFARYAKMLVWPDGIAVAYDLLPTTQPFPWLRLVEVVGLAFTVGVVIVGWRRWPLLAVAVSWALILLAPSSSVFPIMLTMDEVRCYASTLIFFGIAGIGLERIRTRVMARASHLRTAPLLALAPWLILSALELRADWRINLSWGDKLTQGQYAVERYPQSQIANRFLCEIMFERTCSPPTPCSTTDFSPAATLTQCKRAEQLWPYNPTMRYYAVGALVKAGQLDAAEQEARAAVLHFPGAVVAWTALGHVAWMRDDYKTAALAYHRALAMDPLDDGVRIHLADVLIAQGDREGARALVRSFNGAAPGRPEDLDGLRRLAASLGEPAP